MLAKKKLLYQTFKLKLTNSKKKMHTIGRKGDYHFPFLIHYGCTPGEIGVIFNQHKLDEEFKRYAAYIPM